MRRGDALVAGPSGVRLRVVALELRGQRTDSASAGDTVALQIKGCPLQSLRRGMVPCALAPSRCPHSRPLPL